MNPAITTLSRFFGLSVLVLGFSSCSLFKDGKYASQWEIESDVPASLSSGTASVPDVKATANHRVKSNLSRNPEPLSPTNLGELDLPALENNDMAEVPKPDFAASNPVYGQSQTEMLNVPSAGETTEATGSAGGLADLTTLLPEPPPVVTEEELAAAPPALPPVAMDGPLNPEPAEPQPGPVSFEAIGAEVTAGKAPALSATTIPLLYGQLDLSAFLTPAPVLLSPEPQQAAEGPQP